VTTKKKKKKILLIILALVTVFITITITYKTFSDKQRLLSPTSDKIGPIITLQPDPTELLLVKLRLDLLEPSQTQVISDRSTQVTLKSGPVVMFSTIKDPDTQLDSLQLILSQSKIEGRKISRIDLRFDKPVVVYD